MSNSLIALLIVVGLSIFGPLLATKQNDSLAKPGQTFYKGLEYVMNDDNYYSFNYSRTYSHNGSEYITTYTIYPSNGLPKTKIVATHSKAEKKIVVMVEDPNGGVFMEINKEETTYTTASLEPFGLTGGFRALGGNRVPNQLELRFVSNKFENVNVASVYAGDGGRANMIFFVLDRK